MTFSDNSFIAAKHWSFSTKLHREIRSYVFAKKKVRTGIIITST